ncbi:MAG: mechanosensitive ion channel [Caldilineaceae bacterium]|nr:mechanosensitive ion channel [Caldilineaceae bacterium]MBP8106395.1 mechanosensitive ion channel [Caldilineaceae bacterium]MBP8121422.1 mechanosensitive ion channel [Caldilineaceae bacterium]MBP9072724.1 mechanosensitive ion channel [Caldilineaceae bacterium]
MINDWFLNLLTWITTDPGLRRGYFVVIYYVVAWVAIQILSPVVRRAVISSGGWGRSRRYSERRAETLGGLTQDVLRVLVYIIATVAALSLFVDSRGLLTFLGLFSAAFGLGARPLVSDYISGMVFLFEDQYTIGEKVEINGVEGMVEDLNLRTTHLRAPSGEFYVIPNGEVRNVRNFARGTFSIGTIRLQIKTAQLDEAMIILNQVVPTLMKAVPDLLEVPELISERGEMGIHTGLSLVARTQYGRGASSRTQLLSLIHDAFDAGGIEITG